MLLSGQLQERAEGRCELCSSVSDISSFEVPGIPLQGLDSHVLLCSACIRQYEGEDDTRVDHWRCLNDSMWSEHPPVQVLAWRMLHRLRAQGWPLELLEMMYLDDQTRRWAESTELMEGEDAIVHKDVNGQVLEVGDTVTLIKDLNVKGGGFKAKMGTPVRNISLPHDDAEHIEGKVEGQSIYILTRYVKRQK